MRIDGRDAGGGKIKGVTVRSGFRDVLGAERAVGARPVLDHDRLAERSAELVRQQPRHEVGRAARCEADHEADRAGGIVLCVRYGAEQCRAECGGDRMQDRA